MPPKNKKQLEEEAKKLQEEQRLKEEEETRLREEERKKYAQQTIKTGLMLPITAQLIRDFFHKETAFIYGKICSILNEEYTGFAENQKLQREVVKQMQYVIKNAANVWKLTGHKSEEEAKNEEYMKARVLCAIFLKVYLNKHPQVRPCQKNNAKENQQEGRLAPNERDSESLESGRVKTRQEDETLSKQLVKNHSLEKVPGKQMRLFTKQEISLVLKFLKVNYFDHFKIIHNSSKFKSRQDQKTFNTYISTPCVEYNEESTVFIDLSERPLEKQKSNQEAYNLQQK